MKTKTIREHTKLKNVITNIRKLMWKWTGYVIRGKKKWSKLIMTGSHDKRKGNKAGQ